MLRELRNLLAGVRRRRRWQRAGDGLMYGAVLGAVVGLVLEIARLLDAPLAPLSAWIVLLGCALCGGLIAFLLPVTWQTAAHLVDGHYGLKDRALTALEFAVRPKPDPLVRLQLAEAIEHLRNVVPGAVLPRRMPAYAPIAVTLSVCLLGLSLVPKSAPDPIIVDAALQQVVSEQAANLEKTVVEELRELAKEVPQSELQDLAQEIEQLVKELKSPEVDQREALSTLSEMQQQLARALEQFDTEKTDAALKELASAFEPAQSMQAMAASLKDGQYDKAAEKLEKLDASNMSRKERDAVAANLKKLGEKLAEGNPGELSESAREMAAGLEKENESQCKSGACKAAGVCKSQGLRKSISQCLNCQLNRLAECKSQCQSSGLCKADGPAKKSNSPSNQAGKAASNQPTGDETTKLNAQRHRENLTGIQGDGPSERETTQSPEGEQEAARSYAARYTEYRKQMEEVLESEPLPLGHRETVRKYFESIRPSAGDTYDAVNP